MNHPKEEELIAYRDGQTARRETIAEHVKTCAHCSRELARIDALLEALNTLPVPDPGPHFEQRLWQRLAPLLPEKRASWWKAWLAPRRFVTVAAVAAMLIIAFFVGRTSKRLAPGADALSAGQVRERVLVVAVGEHLGRSEMMLMELSNAEPPDGNVQQVNISNEQRRAADLLEENRLYRQTALHDGDTGLASVLDDLERVLTDVAHSPSDISPAELATIRQRIASRGLLFKVRVVSKELQDRQRSSQPRPEPNQSLKKEGNKA